MSHAYGQVKFPSNKIYHFEYDGTQDIEINPLRETANEVSKNWRKYLNSNQKCVCNQQPEKIEIATDYGGGSNWTGTGCERCRVIIKGILYTEEYDGLPDWWETFNEEQQNENT